MTNPFFAAVDLSEREAELLVALVGAKWPTLFHYRIPQRGEGKFGLEMTPLRSHGYGDSFPALVGAYCDGVLSILRQPHLASINRAPTSSPAPKLPKGVIKTELNNRINQLKQLADELAKTTQEYSDVLRKT